MSTSTIALIFFGLFLAGGVFSFWRQKLSKSLIGMLAVGSVLCLAYGLAQL